MKTTIKITAMFIRYIVSCTSFLYFQTLDGCHLYANFMVGYGWIEGWDIRMGSLLNPNSSVTDIYSAGFLWKPKLHYLVHKSLALNPLNPVHTSHLTYEQFWYHISKSVTTVQRLRPFKTITDKPVS